MAIHLITGAPGHGKTLYAVQQLFDKLLKETLSDGTLRQVYTDIDGLVLDEPNLHLLDEPKQWPQLPDGSILVMDECQKYFPPRNGASKVPHYISEFETHRHHGKDVYLITQGPKLIDRHLWPLIDTHTHVYRPFGMAHARLLKWGGLSENPSPSQNKANAEKEYFRYPAKLFDKYKSASDHTVKRKLPLKMFAILGGSIALCVSLAVFAFYQITGFSDTAAAAVVGSEGVQTDIDGNPLVSTQYGCVRVVGRSGASVILSFQGKTVTLPITHSINGNILYDEYKQEVGTICGKQS